MNENGQQPAQIPEPPLIEGPGRYKVFEAPDGGWIVARAGPLCDRCAECGCGDQADPIQVPGIIVKMAQQQGGNRIMSMLRAATGRG